MRIETRHIPDVFWIQQQRATGRDGWIQFWSVYRYVREVTGTGTCPKDRTCVEWSPGNGESKEFMMLPGNWWLV